MPSTHSKTQFSYNCQDGWIRVKISNLQSHQIEKKFKCTPISK